LRQIQRFKDASNLPNRAVKLAFWMGQILVASIKLAMGFNHQRAGPGFGDEFVDLGAQPIICPTRALLVPSALI